MALTSIFLKQRAPHQIGATDLGYSPHPIAVIHRIHIKGIIEAGGCADIYHVIRSKAWARLIKAPGPLSFLVGSDVASPSFRWYIVGRYS